MCNISKKSSKLRLLIVQRVLTRYRYDLLKDLTSYFRSIEIATSSGTKTGTLKLFDTSNVTRPGLLISIQKSLKIGYQGESRSTTLFFYPGVIFKLFKSDIVLVEGTTNFINNIYIVPIAKLLGKKVIWWDAGYSLAKRTLRRKVIDFIVGQLIRFTDAQIAYSTKAKDYMAKYMNAKNCHININTINTDYFEKIANEVRNSIRTYQFDKNKIALLYVGVVEKRKKVKELIEIVAELNVHEESKYYLNIIGGGNILEELIQYVDDNNYDFIQIHGPIYDKEKLKSFYFNSDLFVLPGDGGLAIVQSLLYGLPVICQAADGTEEDYMNDKSNILSNLNELKKYLSELNTHNKDLAIDALDKLSSKTWIEKFMQLV